MNVSIIFVSSILLTQESLGQDKPNIICKDGSEIVSQKICDGTKDCPDGSDETTQICFQTICAADKFRCHYGACISHNLTCDGINHCADASDESQCGRELGKCDLNEYRCANGECISVNKVCDKNNDCKDNSDEINICEKMNCPPHTYRCRVGGCIYLELTCNGRNDCIDGSDESETLCTNLNCIDQHCTDTAVAEKVVACPPITSRRINAHCEVRSGPHKGIISCEKLLPPGTIVKYECKPYYVPAHMGHTTNKEMLCQSDGTWNREQLQCIPDCGSAEPDVAPLIVNGSVAEEGKFPWHAIVFTLEDGKWVFTCGGTLITEKIVLTAAHCTWEVNEGMLQLGFGKHNSDYYKEENYAQITNISKIIRQPLYQDLLGNYGSDIAILVISKPVEFSPMVRPACIDWNLDDITEHLKEDNLGLVVGMGVTENNTFSEKLRVARLPVVNDTECISKQKKHFKKYVTFTSFCAGWRNGTGACNGDSGGGLVFSLRSHPNKFTIQGITSISPRRPGTSFCDTNYYTIFTKVGMYVKWIYNVLKEIHEDVDYKPFTSNVIL